MSFSRCTILLASASTLPWAKPQEENAPGTPNQAQSVTGALTCAITRPPCRGQSHRTAEPSRAPPSDPTGSPQTLRPTAFAPAETGRH
eukprot:1159764-Pelagomonas_calceolata.AAC.3